METILALPILFRTCSSKTNKRGFFVVVLYYVVFIVFSSLKCFVCEIKKLQVSGHLANQMDLVYRITARCMPVVSLIFEHIKCLGLCVCCSEEIMFQFS